MFINLLSHSISKYANYLVLTQIQRYRIILNFYLADCLKRFRWASGISGKKKTLLYKFTKQKTTQETDTWVFDSFIIGIMNED